LLVVAVEIIKMVKVSVLVAAVLYQMELVIQA
jgi:hypothetical protein